MLETNVLSALSDAMVQSVQTAGAATVMVSARRQSGASGVVYQPGLILTANHSVEREKDIRVGLPDGSEFSARLLGRDPGSDLALLHLEKETGALAEPAPAEAQVGQIVLALGRPDENGIQASLGVVGSVGGPGRFGRGGLLERFIRTDVIPYPGFSGGPLVDGDGRVLGINSSGLIPGASIAIPAAQAWRTAQQLSQFGRIRRGYLGIRSQAVELSPDLATILSRSQSTGLLLVGVEQGQPAEQAGLIIGDILVGLAGQPIEEHETLLEALAGDRIGTKLPAEILRGGKLVRLDMPIEERRA